MVVDETVCDGLTVYTPDPEDAIICVELVTPVPDIIVPTGIVGPAVTVRVVPLIEPVNPSDVLVLWDWLVLLHKNTDEIAAFWPAGPVIPIGPVGPVQHGPVGPVLPF